MPSWNELSKDSLSAAQELLQKNRYRSCVSRAYYAVYAAVTWRLLLKGHDQFGDNRANPSHEIALTMLQHNLLSQSSPAVSKKVTHAARNVRRGRLIADYEPGLTIELRDARDSLRDACFVINQLGETTW